MQICAKGCYPQQLGQNKNVVRRLFDFQADEYHIIHLGAHFADF